MVKIAHLTFFVILPGSACAGTGLRRSSTRGPQFRNSPKTPTTSRKIGILPENSSCRHDCPACDNGVILSARLQRIGASFPS
ncbi:MAG: hypothetical protein U0264_11380 [Candidatus Kapaibacterium sp.]